MSNAAILSIKPIYANQILTGTKTIELRKSSMGLTASDVVLVYSSAPEQRFAFWFRIHRVEPLSVSEMWKRYEPVLGINHEDYAAYFGDLDTAVGLHVGEVHPLNPIPLREIEKVVDGFVPPQGLIWLRDDCGRFEKLLTKLSVPLPAELFPQRSLMF
jgi:predicted transcriptional regulator